MRYVCKGEVHRDFHASFLDGVNYLVDHFGEAAAREVLGRTATGVYRTMHEALKAGDPAEFLEWWRYYLEREGGDWRLTETTDGAELVVSRCPALAHLRERGVPGGRRSCWATDVFNAALCRDTPFEIVLEQTGELACRQILRRRNGGRS